VITGRETYEWLIPSDHFGHAHAFPQTRRLSFCGRFERQIIGEPDWVREALLRGEPRRARCPRCLQLIERFPQLQELS